MVYNLTAEKYHKDSSIRLKGVAIDETSAYDIVKKFHSNPPTK
ncbi:MAG TPA: hypothetical protein VJ729_00740 [Nitrososphaeraceae archaeon]|nr:hypothetical protein [Nitrososphaeraceae archaeon]